MATRLSIVSPALTATKSIQAPLHSSTFITSCKKSSERNRRNRQTHRTFHTTSSLESASPKYTYRIAASFTAKDTPYDPSKNKYNFNPSTQTQVDPHNKSLRPDSGQDAFFISPIYNTNDIALGVCDGVGGWADSGVDPADFAHGICNYMSRAAASSTSWTPQRLMERGYSDICHDRKVRAGGSTACIAIAKENGDLEVANLGDSGFIQLRLNAIHSYSEPQTHAFNTPYQLSLIPGQMAARTAAFGGYQLHDLPADSNISKHSLRHGDVVVFATDGVWDNLSSSTILKIISEQMILSRLWEYTTDSGIRVGSDLDQLSRLDGKEQEMAIQTWLAVSVTRAAKVASVNSKVDGPFAREVQRWYPEEGWRGGKVDDICVVVMVVVEEGRGE